MANELVKQVEKRHGIALKKDDVEFISLYQELNFSAKDAYDAMTMKGDRSLLSYIQALKPIIVDIVEANLIMESGKASTTLTNLMDSDTIVPQASIKLEASKTILDRVGLGKRETLQINSGDGQGANY